jgi:hypothetical protein
MASQSDAVIAPPPIHIAKLKIPATTPLEYERVFKHTDEETQIQLKRISDFRNEVVVASERAFGDAAVRVAFRKNENFLVLHHLAALILTCFFHFLNRESINIFLLYLDWCVFYFEQS